MNLSLMKVDIAHQDLNSEEAVMNNITIRYNEARKKKSYFSSHLPAIFKIQSLRSEILIRIKRDRINNKALITFIFFSYGIGSAEIIHPRTMQPRVCQQIWSLDLTLLVYTNTQAVVLKLWRGFEFHYQMFSPLSILEGQRCKDKYVWENIKH